MRVGIAALGALCGTGCLLPQEDGVLEEFPRRNRPPWIREDSVKMNGELPRLVSSGNAPECELHFEALVEDPDVDDLVRWRYYVDFSQANPAPEQEGEFTNTGNALRRESAQLAVPKIAEHPRFGVGTHMVTLMVFDGELGALKGPGSLPPDDLIPGVPDAGNPRYSTTVTWVVAITNSGDCLQ
jgi:hypothetical protein